MSTAVEMIQQVASGAETKPTATEEALLRLDQIRQKNGTVQLFCTTAGSRPHWQCTIIDTFALGCPRASGYGETIAGAIEHAIEKFTAGATSIIGEELKQDPRQPWYARQQEAEKQLRGLVDEFCTLHDCHWLGALQTGEPA